MGKGDKRTAKGKRFAGSYGNARKGKKEGGEVFAKSAPKAAAPKPTEAKAVKAPKAPAKKKVVAAPAE